MKYVATDETIDAAIATRKIFLNINESMWKNEAPSTFLTPISFVLNFVKNADIPINPIPAIKTQSSENIAIKPSCFDCEV